MEHQPFDIDEINIQLNAEVTPVNFGSFEWALVMLKQGYQIRRRSWPTTRFIYKVDGSQFEVNRAPLNSIFPVGTIVNYQPHIDVCENSRDAVCRTYEVTTSDLFAINWEINNEPTH